MSYSCTLHPVDLRVVKALTDHIRSGRADWKGYLRLYRKKCLIQQVNLPFKNHLKDLLHAHPEFNPDLHLWGRPFFIYSNDPEKIVKELTELYGLRSIKDICQFYLRELLKFSDVIYKDFSLDKKDLRGNQPKLGLPQVMQELNTEYKTGRFEILGTEAGFVLAQLLANAYPYWHTDRFGLTFLHNMELPGWEVSKAGQQVLFKDLPELSDFLPEFLKRNLCAGMYLDPIETRDLLLIVKEQRDVWISRMEQKQLTRKIAETFLHTLIEVLTYAVTFNYGLLEASDVFEEIPFRYP